MITPPRFAAITLCVAALLGLALAGQHCATPPVRPQADTFIVLHQRVPLADAAPLWQYDYLVVGHRSELDSLPADLHDRVLLQFNPWAHCRYHDPENWQPGPGDVDPLLGDQVIGGRHLYRIDARHRQQFARWVSDALQQYDVRGVFLDDFAADRFWWVAPGDSAAQAAAEACWPGYPDDNSSLLEFMSRLEVEANDLVDEYVGGEGLVVLNGPLRTDDRSVACREQAGCYRQGSGCKTTWEALTDSTNVRYARRGDWILMNCLNYAGHADGLAQDLVRYGLDLASDQGLAASVTYWQKPIVGGSIYQLPPEPWADPRDWPWKEK